MLYFHMAWKLCPGKPRAAALKSSTLRRIWSGVPVLLEEEVTDNIEFVTGSAEAAPLDLVQLFHAYRELASAASLGPGALSE